MDNCNKKRGRPAKEKNYNSPFAVRLREICNGRTQQEIADGAGITRQNLGRFLLGETKPDTDTLEKLAKYFNVSTDYMLGLTDNKTTDTDLRAVCEYTGLSEKAAENLHNYKTTANSKYRHPETDENGEPCFFTDDEGVLYYRLLEIIDELISNGDMYDLAKALSNLKSSSQDVINNNEIYNTIQMQRKEQGDNRSENEKRADKERKKIQDKQGNDHVDIYRYKLNEFIVHLSDRYDQREQVKNNGNHNPTNK